MILLLSALPQDLRPLARATVEPRDKACASPA